MLCFIILPVLYAIYRTIPYFQSSPIMYSLSKLLPAFFHTVLKIDGQALYSSKFFDRQAIIQVYVVTEEKNQALFDSTAKRYGNLVAQKNDFLDVRWIPGIELLQSIFLLFS